MIRYDYTCERCGTPCTHKRVSAGASPRFCSDCRYCGHRRERRGTTVERDCLWCSEPFRTNCISGHLHCSRECSRTTALVERVWDVILNNDPCAHCRRMFMPRKQAYAKYCSRACYFAAKRNGPRREVEGVSERANHRKRARVYGVRYEPVDRTIVFTRDGWVCKICDSRVVRDTSELRLRASIDHIIPMSIGGPHTYDNVQLAHVGCNSRKHNGSAGSQLQFFGSVL